MKIVLSSIAICLLALSPVAAQDFLAPLQELVDDLVPKPTTPEKAPQPTPPSEKPQLSNDDPPPLPRPRPDDLGETEAAEPAEERPAPDFESEAGAAEPTAPNAADEDKSVPTDRVYQSACPALLSGLVVGEMLDPIEDGMCGERSPLLVNAVRINGREIALSSPVTTSCEMAGAFADWVGEVDRYATAALDAPLASVTTGTSFFCRNRNGAETGFLSEHGFANALDITGFVLGDGREIDVKANWMPASGIEGRLLRQAHGAACGRFTTVLGPEANAEHEDHLHLDLGCYGQTCTAQICE